MSKVLYSCFLLWMSTFLLHAGDGITDGIREEQEAERKSQKKGSEVQEDRISEFRQRAFQRSAQIAQKLAAVDQQRRKQHQEEQENRPRTYDDFGDEPYHEADKIKRERSHAGVQAGILQLQQALIDTGLFHSDRQYYGIAKGHSLPAGVDLGPNITSVRGLSPTLTSQERDQGIQELDKRMLPTGVYTDNGMSALANHGVVVDTSQVHCADLQCVDWYGRRICQGHNLGGTSRVLKVDREDEVEADMFVRQLILHSKKQPVSISGFREKSLPRGKVDRDGKLVGHECL